MKQIDLMASKGLLAAVRACSDATKVFVMSTMCLFRIIHNNVDDVIGTTQSEMLLLSIKVIITRPLVVSFTIHN